MNSKRTLWLFLMGCLCAIGCVSLKQSASREEIQLKNDFVANFKLADSQLLFMASTLPSDKFPKTYYPATGLSEYSNSNWWCSGFYPGSLLLTYQQTGNERLLQEAKRIMQVLKKEQFNTRTHDLGFMMYCSFGNALKIAPDTAYKNILLQSAKSLSTRFNPRVGCIKSWEGKKDEYLVIIDNMMNLELLFWATRETGDSSYYKIACTHANTTIKEHYRPDFSSYHVVNYNATNGEVIQKKTAQGYADNSAWARGQAWGLYGYVVMYRETKDPKYLQQAQHIAAFLLNHPNLPADGIPYWDYNAPDIPNAKRDASAGAIMASAYLELMNYVTAKEAARYKAASITILRSLNSDRYKAAMHSNGGFLLQHSVGHLTKGSEVDVPLTYADYYFLEAMKRLLASKHP